MLKLTYCLIGFVLTISSAIGTRNQTDFIIVLDTCALCQERNRDSNPLKRFKACELLSIQNTLTRCLKKVRRLEKETDELLNSTYERLQKIFILEEIAVRFNKEYYLDVSVGSISKHILHLICQLEPILRSGHFLRNHLFEDRCKVSETIPYDSFDRTGGINSIATFIQESTFLIKITVGNIRHVLNNL